MLEGSERDLVRTEDKVRRYAGVAMRGAFLGVVARGVDAELEQRGKRARGIFGTDDGCGNAGRFGTAMSVSFSTT